MEKLLYALWKPSGQGADAFRDRLLDAVAPELLERVHGLRLCVADSAVEPAAALRQEKLCPAYDGMLSLWVDSANGAGDIETLLAAHCDRFCGYLVTESEPLRRAPDGPGRMAGWTQVVMLERPGHMSEADWLDVWLGSHTGVAIETQSTFAYRQNVVARRLGGEGPAVHAIVEESFPDAAMASPHAFYDAESDEALQARLQAMIESCARFIDFERIEVVPMSEYLLRGLAAPL